MRSTARARLRSGPLLFVASDATIRILRMDRPISFVRTPGSFTGTAPKRYDQGSERRRCACGTVISPYTKGKWCTTCDRNPDRMAHFARAPKEIPVEPSKLKAKQAADRLGVTGKQLKQLERDGRIEAHERGRGLFGSTYLEDDVERLKLELDAEAGKDAPPTVLADAAEQVVHEAAQVANGEALDAELERDEPLQCCGQRPEGDADCSNCPLPESVHGEGPSYAGGRDRLLPVDDQDDRVDAESDDAYDKSEPEQDPEDRVRELEGLHRRGVHAYLQAHALAGRLAEQYREAAALAGLAALEVRTIEREADREGIEVVGGPFPLLDEPVAHLPEDPEIRAMYLVRDALEPLDRDAQLRVVRWALARFGLDRPAREPETVQVVSDGGQIREIPVR